MPCSDDSRCDVSRASPSAERRNLFAYIKKIIYAGYLFNNLNKHSSKKIFENNRRFQKPSFFENSISFQVFKTIFNKHFLKIIPNLLEIIVN